MSHETLANTWSALTGLEDWTAGFRDAIGNATLRQIRSPYDAELSPRRFVECAHELSLAFDAIRFMSKTDSKDTTLLQEDLVSAITFFLHGLANDNQGHQTLLSNTSYRLILGNALCSAVATLRSCAWNCRIDLKDVLSKAANKLLNNSAVKDDATWLVQTVASLLVSHYSAITPPGQGIDQSRTHWKMLWESKPQRNTITADMVRRATDSNVPAIERIVPLLDLCQLYWDTDVVLIQSAAGLQQTGRLSRVFFVPTDEDAVSLAMEVRAAIQRAFAVKTMQRSMPDPLQSQAYVMFRPGLSSDCASDCCSCDFDPAVSHLIKKSQRDPSDILQIAIGAAYQACPITGMPERFFETLHEGYTQRLYGFRQLSNVTSSHMDRPDKSTNDTYDLDELVTAPVQLRPRLKSHQSADDAVAVREEIEDFDVKQRSSSQPDIFRRPLRGQINSVGDSDWFTRNGVLETHNEEAEPEPYENPYKSSWIPGEKEVLESGDRPYSRTESTVPQSPSTQPELYRRESTTTNSTGSSHLANTSQRVRLVPSLTEKVYEECLPEAVIYQDRISPHDYEKSYPEVAINPISNVQDDNMSLFSDSGSVPATTRSGSRVANQKKWSMFRQKKAGGNFAVPTVRFFSSARHIIAWTRYGGACFDVTNVENSRVQPINAGDIVLAAGGTRAYAVIARSEEHYTLDVFQLGSVSPGFHTRLPSCPKSMEMSKDDRYLAIKYSQVVRMFDLPGNKKIDHKLPKMESTSTIPGGHMLAFAHDSVSFMAATRTAPEKVVTYWSHCMDTSKHKIVHSTAPCGNIGDHGITALTLIGPSIRGFATGFLATYTEKGSPVILSMSSQPHAVSLRTSRDRIGTRIHAAGMHFDPNNRKASLLMINHNNEVFWITDVFGTGQDINPLKSLKRPKSMKPELYISMPNADEANVFWIDTSKQAGMLMKIGRSGGMTRPVEIRLDIEPMCSG